MADWVCVLIRHASAGDPETWDGPDDERPLDGKGLRQAEALVRVVTECQVSRLVSPSVLRCDQTLVPAATALNIPIEREEKLGEEGYWGDPDGGLAAWRSIVESGEPTAVCSQGGVIPDVLERSLKAWGHPFDGSLDTKKGAFWVLRLSGGPFRLVDIAGRRNPEASAYPKRPWT